MKSVGTKQPIELRVSDMKLLGGCNIEEYPFKIRTKHAPEYVRQFLHLRPRSRTFTSVLRVRNAMTQAIHKYFQVCYL